MSLEKTFKAGWINLDSWSENYVGIHWLITSELPNHQAETEPRHGPLSQMVLLSSHHLVEVIFFKCVRTILSTEPDRFQEIANRYKKETFHNALEKWPTILVGKSLDINSEPIKSIIRLKERRNATIHKDSALTSLEMARSAFFSAVKGSIAIANHLTDGNEFRYNNVLEKYPLPEAKWFSEVTFVDRLPNK